MSNAFETKQRTLETDALYVAVFILETTTLEQVNDWMFSCTLSFVVLLCKDCNALTYEHQLFTNIKECGACDWSRLTPSFGTAFSALLVFNCLQQILLSDQFSIMHIYVCYSVQSPSTTFIFGVFMSETETESTVYQTKRGEGDGC